MVMLVNGVSVKSPDLSQIVRKVTFQFKMETPMSANNYQGETYPFLKIGTMCPKLGLNYNSLNLNGLSTELL